MRTAMETVAGIQELTPQCLEQIFCHLCPCDAVRASCATKVWRSLVRNDEQLWKRHLAEELGLYDKQGADGSSRPNSWEAYASWRRAFGAEQWPFLGRAIKAWSQIKTWLAANIPEILATIRAGLSEAEVAQVEAELGFALPPALKVLYRLHDGQALASDAMVDRRIRATLRAPYGLVGGGSSGAGLGEDAAASQLANVDQETMALSIFCGLFGGYAVYDHRVVSRMLPLRRAVLWLRAVEPARRQGTRMDRALPWSCSYNLYDKMLMSDLEDGGLMVAKMVSGGFSLRDAVPHADTRDGPLRWLEEYARRLAAGWYEVSAMDEAHSRLSRVISLFPMRPPGLVEAVTQGVRVRASAVYVAEALVQDRHLFAYSIRFCLLENFPLKRCQLIRRHWVIKPEPGRVETVDGEGVIGLYPILEPGQPEFVYCSCSHQTATRGSMEGSFQFVPGTIDRPEGPLFDVVCPAFRLDLPEYVF